MANATVTVESSGGDYISLNAALSGESADLTTDCSGTGGPGILTIQCGNFEDTTAASTGTGYTTSASYYIKIIGDPADIAAGATGKWSTSRYRLSTSVSVSCLSIGESYTQCHDLQVKMGDVSFNGIDMATLVGTVGGIWINRCLCVCEVVDSAGVGFFRGTADNEDAACWVTNCIALGTWSYGFYLRGNVSGMGAHTYSCTAYGCACGFRARSDYCYAKNCVAVGCTDAFLETTAYAVADYCAYDEGTDPGTNGLDVSGYTDDQLFVDADNVTLLSKDLHLAAGSPLIGAGVDTSGEGAPLNFTDDIDGDTRSSWDIGADEYVAVGGTTLTINVSDCLDAKILFGGP